MIELSAYGWNDEWAQKWDSSMIDGLVPARVIADFGTSLKIATPKVMKAELSGRLAHYTDKESIPKIGDWVAVRLSDSGPAVIESVLPRRSEIARKAAGTQTKKQIIAANIDIAFVLLALDNDFSVERLKRFLYQLSIHAIEPVIVLNKADKVSDLEPFLQIIRPLNLPIIVTTASAGIGVSDISVRIPSQKTAILLGSSGVGKSTLTNALLQREAQATQEIRERDETGKHTTVHRELYVLENGGMIVDTPGIRELQLWGTQEDLDDHYQDVAILVQQCAYATCQHSTEDGCAVRAALQNGSLTRSHYASYLQMKSELTDLKVRAVTRARSKNKKPRSYPNNRLNTMLEDDQ